jgi:hypothetical protein
MRNHTGKRFIQGGRPLARKGQIGLRGWGITQEWEPDTGYAVVALQEWFCTFAGTHIWKPLKFAHVVDVLGRWDKAHLSAVEIV